MASFKGNGRGDGPKRRSDDPRRRRRELPDLEGLEQRRLLSTTTTTTGTTWHPTSTNLLDAENGPLANLGQEVVTAYSQYLKYVSGGSKGTFTTPLSSTIRFEGTSIGLDLRGSGSLTTYEAALTSIGMQITSVDTTLDIVEGYVPISDLPAVAEQAQTLGAEPIFKAITSAFVGVADNEGGTAENADAARTTYNVTGAGEKIGVLSDSVSQFAGGLADSVATGDLPNNVQVIQDGQAGDTDEGRAMLENIHDIAPGASLAFATGDGGEVGFANNIIALANAGSNIITDDLSYSDELFFQDGTVGTAVDQVVNQGVVYDSSAGNAADSGYLSQFRGVSASVTGIGAGTFMNFDPSGATTSTLLPIQVYSSAGGITFEFDQPVVTGSNGVTSQVNFYVLDQNNTVVASGTTNNVATGEPIQFLVDANGNPVTLPVGNYNVAIQLVSGPAPAHVQFAEIGDGGFNVTHVYGSAGGTFYPSTVGHHAIAANIDVGAVPWFNTSAYETTPTTYNEDFSSFGPSLSEFNADGSPKTAVLVDKPDISGADGGNTSFFYPGEVIDTTNPPNPGHPPFTGQAATTHGETATATNLSQVGLPSFFGTSSAAPNVAAVIALMKQANPTLTRTEILTALESSATPLNGSTAGTYNIQGGYGLINAAAAINAAETLKVVSLTPGGGATVGSAPSVITVVFSQPVSLASIVAANLSIVGPNGTLVTVGIPVGVDSATFPTTVAFPITITPAAGGTANGIYTEKFVPGKIVAETGTPLVGTTTSTFNIQVLSGPKVVNTTFFGRIVTIYFNEALNPATATAQNIYVFRDNGVNAPNFNTNAIIVSDLPGATFTYNATNFTVTINLTGVAQSSLPTDHYGVFAYSFVKDTLGNPLNGNFSGVFPSGTTPPSAIGSNFFQDLGVVTLQAPIITSLSLATSSDSGITGDNNTDVTTPSITGQVTAPFPATVSNDLIYAEFDGIVHTGVALGGLDLGVGANGRGFIGHFDVQTTTNALGQFTINYPAGVTPLPNGENKVRVVVVGANDLPPFPGLSSSLDYAFRVDTTDPYVSSGSITEGENISTLSSLTLNIVDPISPTTIGSPFAVDTKFSVPALNPVLADTVSNYQLYLVNSNGTLTNESSFITSATFTSTSARVLTSDPYTGSVAVTFAPGLPAGSYKFWALSSVPGTGLPAGTGLSDAAGNPFAGYLANSQANNPVHYLVDFNLQPTPTYITNYAAITFDSSQASGFDATGPRANYELPVSGVTARSTAPPNEFVIDFSNPLALGNYTNDVELVRSANSTTAQPDGNFGDLGITNTTGFTPVTGVTVTLGNSVAGAVFGQYGYDNRLLIQLPAGLTLPADYYRIYLPNSGSTTIDDVYGNQLDGEFLGYQNANGKYVDQLPNGTIRGSGATELPDLTGDGTPGGAFMTGFVVVPNGGIIYARADAIYNPLIPSQTPNGSLALPYPVLAAEAVPTAANGGNLNSSVNAGANFNTAFDYSGDGQFEPSAFYAAQLFVQETGGPVVIIAEQSIPTRNTSGAIVQQPFVLQAPTPSGTNTTSNGSAAVPALTTLVFDAGSILKMQNAALLVQNQGSALQVLGNANFGVTITSYKDSSIGGVSNNNPSSVPSPGDYGGIVFRNYSQAALPGTGNARVSLFPGQIPITGNPVLDDRLKGPFANSNNAASQVDAISGADDIMSYVNYLTEKYAGGAVPQTTGVSYDGVTLQNSRPTIVNSIIADAGGQGAVVAGLSVDVDSLRADDVAQGPLIRNDQFINNGLNGIYIRAEVSSGVAEPTNAIDYPNSPISGGPSVSYVLDDPYPYLLTSKLDIGRQLVVESGGTLNTIDNRLYVDPGMVVKFEQGAWIEVNSSGSLNVGDSTYIKEFDANNLIGPTFAATNPDGSPNPLAGQTNPNFKANSSQLAQAIFTSLNDNAATSTFFNSQNQTTTTIVAPLNALPTGAAVIPVARAQWGGIQLDAGSVDVINSADIRYGGGTANTGVGTEGIHALEINPGDNDGAFISITNNTFFDNADVAVNMTPDALMAGDPTRPLDSGDPFIHGNIFTDNAFNGVGIQGGTGGVNAPNLLVNSVWTGGDFTYILRATIVEGGGILALPSSTGAVAEPTPIVTLTLQSTLPGTILADGSVVASPGVPLIIKLLNPVGTQLPADSNGAVPAATIATSYDEGAGFVVGADNGVDPTADSLIDPGAFSQLRILGIPANQTTGQGRVPVVITSIHDSTVGTTVNNVQMDQVIPNDTTAPAAGDGGAIYFGGNMLTDYNLLDPRDGSIIDNADIKYITRIEQEGGGVLYGFDTVNNPTSAFIPSYNTLMGLPLTGNMVGTEDQYNAPKTLTISDSNLSTFSDIGFFAQPGYASIVLASNYPGGAARDTSFLGEPTRTFLVNDTFSNMPTAVEIISQKAEDVAPNNGPFPSAAELISLNDTYYNNGVAIHTISVAADGTNFFSNVSLLAMDNIFDDSTTAAVETDGQTYEGGQGTAQLQYNVFDGNALNVGGLNPVANVQPIISSAPLFRNPAAGNFFLLSTAAAIDVARSELGPSIFGNLLSPAVTINQANLAAIPVRNFTGDSYPAGGGYSGPLFATDIVTLPGEPVTQRGFPDLWVPTLVSSGLGTGGTAANAGTYEYLPITGERDQAGNLRVKDPNSPNIGFGSRPYFDDGAFEYIIQNPPVVDSVTSVNNAAGIVTTSNLYGVGVVAGTNKLPSQILIQFNEQLDPSSINANSVLFEASGGDGIFGNDNAPTDTFISLAGLLSFNATTDILTINTAAIFASLTNANDEYRIVLKGTGSYVIRNTDGLALDGLNLDANGNQLMLPSGADDFPGSDFQVTFTIDTHTPSIVPGSFVLDPASNTSGLSKNITKQSEPTFDGTITDTFPPINPLIGQTVIIDVSTLGNGVFNLLDAGTGTTDANGNFKITLTKPIPNTPNTIGTDGIQGDAGATYTYVRVRVINTAGNASNLPSDSFTTYFNEGAVVPIQVDTTLPRISAFSPLGNTVATVNASGQIAVSVTFNKNIKTSTLNSSSILVERSGGTGNFTNPIAVPIIASSLNETYFPGSTGLEQVNFLIAGPLPNDEYEITLKGTGTAPITDLAGNPLSGAFTGTFPTGTATATAGSDFVNLPNSVYQATSAHLIYVQAPSVPALVGTGTLGSRENPFPTIAQGLAVALIGDDVLVLPGTYKTDVTVPAGVRLLSAALTSTDTTYTPGSPLQTLIYGVNAKGTALTTTGNAITTVVTVGAIPGIPTEISGFSIISPLVGNTVTGAIDPTNVGILAFNSNALIDRDYFINSGLAVSLGTSGANAATSTVEDNLIAGNINGIGITDTSATTSTDGPFFILNNTIVDNTTGLYNVSSTPGVIQAFVQNNIFASNHDLSLAKIGTGIFSYTANTLAVGTNMFYLNGPNALSSSNATGSFAYIASQGLTFVPANLTTNPDILGNFIGNPAFVQAEDPRPNGDTPAVFFNFANFDLTSKSGAINTANEQVAPATDILYRTPVKIAGHGFGNTGPASVGAYYYLGTGGPPTFTGLPYTGGGTTTTTGSTGTGSSGTGGTTGITGTPVGTIAGFPAITTAATSAVATPATTVTNSTVGGGIAVGSKQFTVLTTSLSDNGTAESSDTTGVLASLAAPSYIDINFSDSINPSTISASDLVIAGTGSSLTSPVKATSLGWIDDHAVRFFLSGSFNPAGAVNISLSQGSIADIEGDGLNAFSDTFQIAQPVTVLPTSTAPVATTPVAVTVNPAVGSVSPTTVVSATLPVVQPVAVTGPVATNVVIPTTTTDSATKKPLTKAQQAAAAKEAKLHAAQVKAAEAKAAKIAAEAKAAKLAAEAKAAKAAKAAEAAKLAAEVKAAKAAKKHK